MKSEDMLNMKYFDAVIEAILLSTRDEITGNSKSSFLINIDGLIKRFCKTVEVQYIINDKMTEAQRIATFLTIYSSKRNVIISAAGEDIMQARHRNL